MSSALKVAVTSRSFSRHEVLRAELLAQYPDAKFNDAGSVLSGESLIEFLGGCEGVIIGLEKMTRPVLEKLPQLKVISKYGVGLDMLDLEAMKERGIALGWTAGVNRLSVAELALAFAISLVRRLPAACKTVLDNDWRQIVGRELSGQKVGIIGCGNVGKELVRLLKPFNCQILVYDIQDYHDFYKRHDIASVDLETLLKEAVVISIHVPLDNSTRLLLNHERLALLRTDSCLINTARGDIVDEGALKQLLVSGKICGAAFDVFGVEPPQDKELLCLPNFLATPHIGGSSEEAILAMGRAAIKGLEVKSGAIS